MNLKCISLGCFYSLISIFSVQSQIAPPYHNQLLGGSEFVIKHRPDIADSAFQVQFRVNKPCHNCSGFGYGLGVEGILSFTDTCNYKFQNYNVMFFSNAGGVGQGSQLYVNPYSGDSLQKPIFKSCQTYPPINVIPPSYLNIGAPIQDTFSLLLDYWYDTILYLPEKCGKWQVVNYAGMNNGNTHWTILGRSGYSIATNIDTNDYINYAPPSYWAWDNRGVTHINTLVSNSSPYFLSQPTAIFRRNIPSVYKQQAIDPDGDSLVFSSIHLVYHDTVWGLHSQSWWDPFIPQNQNLTGCWAAPAPDSTQSGLRRIPGYNCIPGMGNLPNCPRYDPVYNPFDTDSTFNLNPATGEITFVAKSSPQFVHLLLKCDEYRNGVWVGAVNRRVNFFIFDSINQVEPILTVDTAALVNVTMDSNYVFRTYPNQFISIPYHVKGAPVVSFLKVKDNHAISIPGATMQYQNQITDSVHGMFNWNIGINDTGWYYVLIDVEDSACATSPYINNYNYLFKINVDKKYAPAPDGIREIEKPITKFNIYPNPSKGSIYVKGAVQTADIPYKIANILGEILLQGRTKVGLPISVKQIPSGIYFMQVANEMHRFVKE
nr:T9SS type A sorting domain-containing protein [Chitinophagaceae bacterium]